MRFYMFLTFPSSSAVQEAGGVWCVESHRIRAETAASLHGALQEKGSGREVRPR